MGADQVVVRDGAPQQLVGAPGGCATSARPTTSTGTCSASSATSCAGPAARARWSRTARAASASATATPPPPRATCPPTRARPIFTSRCGLLHPNLLGIREGISVGYGDDYKANLEGQWLALNGLAPGRYLLVHRVNADRRLRERSYSNNAASLLLRLRWRHGPRIDVLATCPSSARCRREAPLSRCSGAAGAAQRRGAACASAPSPAASRSRGRSPSCPGGARSSRNARGGCGCSGATGGCGARRSPACRSPRRARAGCSASPSTRASPPTAVVYLYFTTASGMRLERRRFTGSRLVREATLVDAIRAGRVHDSGRIALRPRRRLYVSTGDAATGGSRRTRSLNGKLLRSPARVSRHRDRAPGGRRTGLRNRRASTGTGSGRVATEHGPTGSTGPRATTRSTRSRPAPTTAGRTFRRRHRGRALHPAAARLPDAIARRAPRSSRARPLAGTSCSPRCAASSCAGSSCVASRRPRPPLLWPLRPSPHRVEALGALRPHQQRDGRGTPRRGDDRILRVVPPR